MGAAVDFSALERIEQQLAQLTERLPGIIEDRVRAILAERDEDTIGGLAHLAGWIGAPSSDACRKRVGRDPELAALAIGGGEQHRRWRKSEVMALLASRRSR